MVKQVELVPSAKKKKKKKDEFVEEYALLLVLLAPSSSRYLFITLYTYVRYFILLNSKHLVHFQPTTGFVDPFKKTISGKARRLKLPRVLPTCACTCDM